ncbi:M28 family peptidase [Croceicoccus hydrothermalis]|uniref:M28 family peptidase n=1 Tax=Croceicoccus hydrothermalis TaxID=2867964 RepID=UPI001EFBE753|nr:M28 family peptidase [Croceicoccus hydrothermalis]
MNRTTLAAFAAIAPLALAGIAPSAATAQVFVPAAALDGADARIAAARDAAMDGDDIAMDFVEGITTEVGPRQAGTPAEARGREWAVRWLRANGFSNVRDEPYTMPTWVRGAETAEIVSPFAQPLHLTALGNSGSTGAQGIEAEIVAFENYAALAAAPEGSLAGKIAYIGHQMRPAQDGSSYGFAGPARWTGPALAARKRAIAAVIKSVGTDTHRMPHTGNTGFAEGQDPIPAAALSVPDAENLERMARRADAAGTPLVLRLTLTPQQLGEMRSGNVIAEIPGRDPSLPLVLLACHLDSWDLGTGAIDDASGCGIAAAAAKGVAAQGQPLRTIRVLFAGAEEVGVWGGKAYAASHGDEPHGVAYESDFGADRIWRMDTARLNAALADRIAGLVAPLGVARGSAEAGGGADIGAIIAATDMAVIDLQQDGTRYFELHHTADDTLDKIDPAQLRQNVAAWVAATSVLANAKGPLRAE